MQSYLLRRLLQTLVVVLATTMLIYAAVYALPGDPVQALAGTNRVVSPALRHAITEHYHLDRPFFVQYWYYLGNLLQGDFGTDLQNQSIGALIAASWPVTVKLALTTWLLQSIVGVVLGTWAGIRAGKFDDIAILGGVSLIAGIPYFVLAFVAQIFIGVKLGLLPTSGITDGWPVSYLLPAAVLATLALPETVRLTRSGVAEALLADYVDTATAKGVPQSRIIIRHVLKNAWLPVVSLFGTNLGYLLGGSVLIEGIFNIPGLGYRMYLGIQQHDGPVIVGIGVLLVLVFVLINLVVDLLYSYLDPRVRLD